VERCAEFFGTIEEITMNMAFSVASIAALALAVVVGVLPVGIVDMSAHEALPQQSVPAPAFEVASVKVNPTRATTGEQAGWSFRVSPSGIVAITNYSLRMLIVEAYGIAPQYERYSPEGGPASILSTRFDISARMPVDSVERTADAQNPPQRALRIAGPYRNAPGPGLCGRPRPREIPGPGTSHVDPRLRGIQGRTEGGFRRRGSA
jgi:hypothetical protein